ncbi:hypothetical protein GBO37_10455 [Paracoccus sp. 08]|nr:hypothetical protein [Paracoccus sp. 08]
MRQPADHLKAQYTCSFPERSSGAESDKLSSNIRYMVDGLYSDQPFGEYGSIIHIGKRSEICCSILKSPGKTFYYAHAPRHQQMQSRLR